MSDLWCHRKLSGCEKNTLRHNDLRWSESTRPFSTHVPNRIKGIEAVAHQGLLQVVWFWSKADFISPDFAFMCEGLVLPSFPPSFRRDLPDLPDPAARWWIATRMASWWWKRSNRVSFRAPTATASSTRPSRCPPPKPSRTARICQDSRGRMLLACTNMFVTWVDWIWLRSVAKDQQNSPKVWWNFGFRFWPIDSKPFWETPCNQSPVSKRTWNSHGCPWRGWHMLSQLVATLAPPWIPIDPDFQAWTAKYFQFALHVKNGMGWYGHVCDFHSMTFIFVSSSQPQVLQMWVRFGEASCREPP